MENKYQNGRLKLMQISNCIKYKWSKLISNNVEIVKLEAKQELIIYVVYKKSTLKVKLKSK